MTKTRIMYPSSIRSSHDKHTSLRQVVTSVTDYNIDALNYGIKAVMEDSWVPSDVLGCHLNLDTRTYLYDDLFSGKSRTLCQGTPDLIHNVGNFIPWTICHLIAASITEKDCLFQSPSSSSHETNYQHLVFMCMGKISNKDLNDALGNSPHSLSLTIFGSDSKGTRMFLKPYYGAYYDRVYEEILEDREEMVQSKSDELVASMQPPPTFPVEIKPPNRGSFRWRLIERGKFSKNPSNPLSFNGFSQNDLLHPVDEDEDSDDYPFGSMFVYSDINDMNNSTTISFVA